MGIPAGIGSARRVGALTGYGHWVAYTAESNNLYFYLIPRLEFPDASLSLIVWLKGRKLFCATWTA